LRRRAKASARIGIAGVVVERERQEVSKGFRRRRSVVCGETFKRRAPASRRNFPAAKGLR